MNQGLRLVCVLVFIMLMGAGCGSSCPTENQIAGVCAGVSDQSVCGSDFCDCGAPCSAVVRVHNDGELQAAAAGAAPGTCIELGSGAYADVTLPGGVSLIGRRAADVKTGHITVSAGAGAVVCGLTARGVTLDGTTGAEVKRVDVLDSTQSGVELRGRAAVTLSASRIHESDRYGLYAAEGSSATVIDSIIENAHGPGVWTECKGGCGACSTAPTLTLRRTILRRNHIGGVALATTRAIVEDVDIRNSLPGDRYNALVGGSGLSVSECSELSATRMRIFDNTAYGILIDHSSAALGQHAGDGIEVNNNTVGLWVRNIDKTQDVQLHESKIVENQGVGIGISDDILRFIICHTAVHDTRSRLMPYRDAMGNIGGSKKIGHGLNWIGVVDPKAPVNSNVMVDGLDLKDNALGSMVIEGNANGMLSNVTQAGTDQASGIVQQNVGAMATSPMIGPNAPAISQNKTQVFGIAVPPPSLPPI